MLDIELHITCHSLSNDKLPAFERFCHSINAKPIVILLSNGENIQQPMISKIVTCLDKNGLEKELNCIKRQFIQNGYGVVRVKMEVAPWDVEKATELFGTNEGNYFEWHGKIKLENEEEARAIILDSGGRISRNVLKKDPHSKFITIRHYGSLVGIKRKIHELKSGLNQNGIGIIKEELEYCIHDSNVALDKDWI